MPSPSNQSETQLAKRPPVLEYGHAEAPWRAELEKTEQWFDDQHNAARYWFWYFGGPRWWGVAFCVAGSIFGLLFLMLGGDGMSLAFRICPTAFVLTLLATPKRREW